MKPWSHFVMHDRSFSGRRPAAARGYLISATSSERARQQKLYPESPDRHRRRFEKRVPKSLSAVHTSCAECNLALSLIRRDTERARSMIDWKGRRNKPVEYTNTTKESWMKTVSRRCFHNLNPQELELF